MASHHKYDDDPATIRHDSAGKRIVRVRKASGMSTPVGRLTMWTLTDPFSRRHLIAAQMMRSQAELVAQQRGWRVLA